MRNYNFPVSFSVIDERKSVCRVRLNTRFSPQEMVGDYPKNTTQFFFEEAIRTRGSVKYLPASGNGIDIVFDSGPLEDYERAILLNLIDFGQDFEKIKSTTVEEVIFFVPEPDSYTVSKLQEALNTRTDQVRAELSDAMAKEPTHQDDPYIAKSWPTADHHRYRFSLFWRFSSIVSSEIASYSDSIHRLVMWNGLSTTMTANEAVEGKYTGVAYECFVEGSEVEYGVERPSCDPAISIGYLLSMIKAEYNLTPISSEITVVAE